MKTKLDQERGARIEELRIENGLSQMDLARELGYKSDSTISKWESGSSLPTGVRLVRLAQSLGTTTDYILFGNQPNNYNVYGDNNGVMDAGRHNTNHYNFGGSSKQDDHNDMMKSLGIADTKLSRALLNAQKETNKKLDRLIQLQEEYLELMKRSGD